MSILRKLFLLILILHGLSVKAQYFDWNIFFDNASDPHENVGINRLAVSPKGDFILNSSHSYWDQTYYTEAIYNTNGLLLQSHTYINYDQFFIPSRHSYFDYSGNLIQLDQDDSGYVFNYYRTSDTLNFHLKVDHATSSNPEVASDVAGGFYLLFQNYTGMDSVQVYNPTGTLMNTVFHPLL